MEDCLRVLQVRQDAVVGDELTRGLAGEPLTVGDKSLVELKPLKAFLPGEVSRRSFGFVSRVGAARQRNSARNVEVLILRGSRRTHRNRD